jgi:hypothetical protein
MSDNAISVETCEPVVESKIKENRNVSVDGETEATNDEVSLNSIDASNINDNAKQTITLIADTDVATNNIFTSIGTIVLKNIDDESFQLKFDISKKHKNIIEKIIAHSPDFFDNIKDCLREIIKDDKISVHDIPQFINIIKYLFDIVKELRFKFSEFGLIEVVAFIMKFAIKLIIEENVLKIPDSVNKTALMIDLEKLVDSCIHLLNVVEHKNCFRCF